MKARIKVQPTGLYNGDAWPEPGQVVDLPDHVAEGMIAAGIVERVVEAKPEPKPRTEKRPAARKGVETRKSDDASA
jgi:hypothetical protein